MFDAEERQAIRGEILDFAKFHPAFLAGAMTGSMAFDDGDQWSDIDLFFSIDDATALPAVLDEMTMMLDEQWKVVHWWDLPAPPALYRVFQLANGLEINIGVANGTEAKQRSPRFRQVFGPAFIRDESTPAIDMRQLQGFAWHHLAHANSRIARGKPWEALYWLSEARNVCLTLACIRLKLPHLHARGFDALPPSVTDPWISALPRSCSAEDLRQVWRRSVSLCLNELAVADHDLAQNLARIFRMLDPGLNLTD